MKKALRLGLIAAMLLVATIFAGCGKKSETTTVDKNTIYKEEDLGIAFPENVDMTSPSIHGNNFYCVGSNWNDTTGQSTYAWYIVDLTTKEIKEHSIDVDSDDFWVDTMTASDDGTVYLFYSEYYEDDSDPENYTYEQYYYMSQYDSDGNLLNTLDLSQYDVTYINTSVVTDDSIVINDGVNMYSFSTADLSLKNKVEIGSEYYNSFIKLRDGKVVTYYWNDDGDKIAYFDTETLTRGDEISVPFSVTNASFVAGNVHDLVYTDSTQMYSFNIGDAEASPMINFINSDLYTSSFSYVSEIDDTSFIGVYQSWEEDDYGMHICKYTRVNPEDIVDKDVITLGCLYIDDDVKKAVINFNKSSDTCRITIKDYSTYNTDDDYSLGQTRFNNDIASGNAPDIICSYSSTVSEYAKKGLYKDLTDYIKNDPDIDYDDIFPNLLEATSVDGKVYSIVPSFNVLTLMGRASILGDRTGWTMDEMMEVESSLPEGMSLFSDMSQTGFLTSMLQVDYDDLIDFANNKCYFDGEEFAKILAYAATLPTEDDIEALYNDDDYWSDYESKWRNGTTLLYNCYISDAYTYNQLSKGIFGEPITCVGYPSEDGTGNAIAFNYIYCMSSKTKHPDECWQILRTFLLPDYQENNVWSIPASMSRFDEMLEEAKTQNSYEDEDGGVIIYNDTYYIGGEEIEITPMTDDEATALKNVILSADKLISYDNDVFNIVLEEVEPYFEGQKTADEVAQIIQSRVSIYINERN